MHKIILSKISELHYEILYVDSIKIFKIDAINGNKYKVKIELGLRGLKIKNYLGLIRDKKTNQIRHYHFLLTKSIA